MNKSAPTDRREWQALDASPRKGNPPGNGAKTLLNCTRSLGDSIQILRCMPSCSIQCRCETSIPMQAIYLHAAIDRPTATVYFQRPTRPTTRRDRKQAGVWRSTRFSLESVSPCVREPKQKRFIRKHRNGQPQNPVSIAGPVPGLRQRSECRLFGWQVEADRGC